MAREEIIIIIITALVSRLLCDLRFGSGVEVSLTTSYYCLTGTKRRRAAVALLVIIHGEARIKKIVVSQ